MSAGGRIAGLTPAAGRRAGGPAGAGATVPNRAALRGGSTRGALALAFAPLLAGPLAAALTLLPPVPAQAQVGGGAAAAQVQALEEEVRRLNGRIQELQHQLREISQDAALRINDLEYRVTALEGGDTSLVGDPVPLGQSGGAPSGGGGQAVAVSEKVALDDARKALNSGDVEGARVQLLNFLSQYPDGPLSAEAEHMLGQAQWQLGQTRQAAQTFLTNVTAFPQSPQAPESLLMLGRALQKLGQTHEACLTLAEVRTRYPGASAAEQADAERKRLACP